MIKTTLRQYQREFINDDGTIEIWKYDLDKFDKGPIESTTMYAKDYKSPLEIVKAQNKDVPLTKQQWLNPTNGKMVGYTRAKSLGLIK